LGSSQELVKLYYRIGEVAQIVGVQPHVLRYWETEFRTIRPQKSHKGQRVYSRRDVDSGARGFERGGGRASSRGSARAVRYPDFGTRRRSVRESRTRCGPSHEFRVACHVERENAGRASLDSRGDRRDVGRHRLASAPPQASNPRLKDIKCHGFA
jgi:hypothetical protein